MNEIAARGTAHQRWTVAGGRTAGTGVGTMSGCVSITDLTTDSAWIAGLAIVALIAAGWRKPARATAGSPRGSRSHAERLPIDAGRGTDRSTAARQCGGGCGHSFASSAIAVIMGAVVATFVAAAIGYSVVTLTDMLRR